MVAPARLESQPVGLSADPRIAWVLRSGSQPDDPLVSVVVCTRNHAAWLAETVEAIAAQDLQGEMELIVCDDAATDDTGSLLRQAVTEARGPITVIRLQERVGQAQGRNVALGFARGRFIAFTDSDCVPSTRWLSAAIRAFEEPGVGIVQGRTRAARVRAPFFAHHIETNRLDGTFATANVVYRRGALGEHRFDPACWSPRWTWEDTDLGWRVRASGWSA